MLPDYLIKDGEHVLDYARRMQERAKLTIADGEYYINKSHNYIDSLVDCVNDLVNELVRQKELAGGNCIANTILSIKEEKRKSQFEQLINIANENIDKGKNLEILIKWINNESNERPLDGV